MPRRFEVLELELPGGECVQLTVPGDAVYPLLQSGHALRLTSEEEAGRRLAHVFDWLSQDRVLAPPDPLGWEPILPEHQPLPILLEPDPPRPRPPSPKLSEAVTPPLMWSPAGEEDVTGFERPETPLLPDPGSGTLPGGLSAEEFFLTSLPPRAAPPFPFPTFYQPVPFSSPPASPAPAPAPAAPMTALAPPARRTRASTRATAPRRPSLPLPPTPAPRLRRPRARAKTPPTPHPFDDQGFQRPPILIRGLKDNIPSEKPALVKDEHWKYIQDYRFYPYQLIFDAEYLRQQSSVADSIFK